MVTHSAQFSIDLFEYIIYCFGTLPNHSHQTIIIKWIIQESSQLAWGNIMGESARVCENIDMDDWAAAATMTRYTYDTSFMSAADLPQHIMIT